MEPKQALWEEVKRQAVRQEANLDLLRSRAITLLGASGVIAALFAGRVNSKNLKTWQSLTLGAALVCFVVETVLCVVILWPRDFAFSPDLREWKTRFLDGDSKAPSGQPITTESFAWALSSDFITASANNQRTITKLTHKSEYVCGLLASQVVLWAVTAI